MTDTTRRPIILDVDTGVDDALALAFAVSHPGLDLVAVTTLSGNVDVTKATENTRRVLAFVGRDDVPVHRGASRPLARAPRGATYAHGNDGLGGAQLPEASRPLEEAPGPATIIRLARERPGELTLVAVGPLTNLAIALNVEPRVAEWIPRLVVMGGAYRQAGNVTPHAEFNTWEDPEAAAQVFAAPFAETTLIGLDVTTKVGLARGVWERLPGDGRGAARLARLVSAGTFNDRGLDEVQLHDPLAVGVAADPSLVEVSHDTVAVTLSGEEEGRTVVTGAGSLRVATAVDREQFLGQFHRALGIEDVTTA